MYKHGLINGNPDSALTQHDCRQVTGLTGQMSKRYISENYTRLNE